MRWEDLFADLEAQFDAEAAAQRAAEIVDRTRLELGRLTFLDRLRGSPGSDLRIAVRGAGTLRGRLSDVGADWFLLCGEGMREALIPVDATLSVRGLGPLAATVQQVGPVASRLTLRYALRILTRDRAEVRLSLIDGTAMAGVLDRVGTDFVELAEQQVDGCRWTGGARRTVAVPLCALGAVWRR